MSNRSQPQRRKRIAARAAEILASEDPSDPDGFWLPRELAADVISQLRLDSILTRPKEATNDHDPN